MSISFNAHDCANKQQQSYDLEIQVQKFITNGGEIRTNNEKKPVHKLIHGTRHAYNIASCRCAVCVSWYQLKASKTKARRAA